MASPDPGISREADFEQYLTALLEGDTRMISMIIERLLAENVPLNSIYLDFVQRGLYEIGRLWECNQIPVSVEHLSASATQVALSELYLRLQRPRESSPEVIIACVSNEMHDVGTMIVANLCELCGCKSILLGANTPTKDVLTFIEQRRNMPDLLALSVTLPANRGALENILEAATSKFPHLEIVIGGQALDGHEGAVQYRNGLLAKFPTVRYMQTLDELERFLRELAAGS